MSDDRRILTWSLNAGTAAYNKDLEQFSHKIYSIGLHEFGVTAAGKVYNYSSGDSALYFNADGTHTGVLMKFENERDNIKYPSIKWYMQAVCFGWSKVQPFLDNDVINAEGRLPQAQFIHEMGKLYDLYAMSRVVNGYIPESVPLQWEGIEMDVEATLSDVVTTVAYDEKYIEFLKSLKNQLCIPRDLKLRINSFAMWGHQVPYYYRFHNYELFAISADSRGDALIDELQLMSYDFAWSGSAPGASTPTWWFKEVAAWASKCFDQTLNPAAKLTIDNVFMGCAGYGNRWGLSDPDNLRGSSVTFRNLLEWENGLRRHYHYDTDGVTIIYENQEFLMQNGFEDPLSKNQLLLPHVYDFRGAQYGQIVEETAAHGTYNAKNYITSYTKSQQSIFTGIKQIVNVVSSSSGKVSAAPNPVNRKVNEDLTVFPGNQCDRVQYLANTELKACTLEDVSEGRLVYNVNPGVGTFKVIALVSFPGYSQSTLGGDIDGTDFTLGGQSLPDYYPYMFKSSHWYDMGSHTFDSSGCAITVKGELGDYGTQIYGFVICSSFDENLRGGDITLPVNIKPFKDKNKVDVAIPTNLVISTEILRQEARPVILWEDRFSPYVGVNPLLGDTSYYRTEGSYTSNGATYSGGDCVESYEDGFTWGNWIPYKDESSGIGYARFDYTDAEAVAMGGSGQLIFNHLFNGNVEVNADVEVETGKKVGIRFGSTGAGNGYVFSIDYELRKVDLLLENPYPDVTVLATEVLSDSIVLGDRLSLRVIMHGGKGYFYMGSNGGLKQVFGSTPIQLSRTAGGGCGVYAYNSKVRVYVLGISSTDRWEPMEKFAVEVGGQTYNFGEISRPGYSYDKWGYLIYSGLDENVTRADTTDVSLDYQFQLLEIPGFQGAADIKIKLIDAGLWFANIYVGDAEGCSVAYVGDADTFNSLMNIAVNDHGAKGIGLWVLGQEDPSIFPKVPDVVAPI